MRRLESNAMIGVSCTWWRQPPRLESMHNSSRRGDGGRLQLAEAAAALGVRCTGQFERHAWSPMHQLESGVAME